jgi:hypothetical protein
MVPVYDFKHHSRVADQFEPEEARPVIIVEGILIFADPVLRDILDIKIFVDTDPDLRFIRRYAQDRIFIPCYHHCVLFLSPLSSDGFHSFSIYYSVPFSPAWYARHKHSTNPPFFLLVWREIFVIADVQ